MQDAKLLSHRDIARLQTAIDRLVKIGEALQGKNGSPAAKAKAAPPAPKRKRRKRRTKAEMEAAKATVTERLAVSGAE